jgi:hypothetical protein
MRPKKNQSLLEQKASETTTITLPAVHFLIVVYFQRAAWKHIHHV